MFYLTTHSTHFILRLYGIRRLLLEGKGNVLFNDAFNTFYFTVIWHQKAALEGKGNVLFNNALNTFYFTVIWHQKAAFRRERKCFT